MDSVSRDEMSELYKLGLKQAHGELSMSFIMSTLPQCSERKAKDALQNFVKLRMATEPRMTAMGDYIVGLREQDLALKLKSLSVENYMVFCGVEKASTTGTGTRELLKAVNEKIQKRPNGGSPLTATKLTQILKNLQASKFIKEIKSIQNKQRKIYIVAHLEADESIVGGVFYKDGVFDEELVESYRERILQYLGSYRLAKVKDIIECLKSVGFKENLGESDMEKVFNSLVLDQYITPSIKDTELYYGLTQWPDFEDIERLPCLSCPVQTSCQIEDVDHFDSLLLRQSITIADQHKELKLRREKQTMGDIDGMETNNIAVNASNKFSSKVTPANCPYYSQWLSLTFDPCVPKPSDEDDNCRQNLQVTT